MIKAKEVSVKNVAVFLAVSFVVSAGYMMSRTMVASRSTPVFMAEEVVVNRTAAAAKEMTVPAPLPQTAVPLPIVPPMVTFKVLPAYPMTALEKGLAGTTLLSVYVGLSGQVEKVETKIASGIAALDQAAITAVSQWRFSPASRGGQALASWFEVPVRFEVK